MYKGKDSRRDAEAQREKRFIVFILCVLASWRENIGFEKL